MATMLIDGTKEIACRAAEADAIRAKTGDDEEIEYDFDNGKGFADAIAAIPSGGSVITFSDTDFSSNWKSSAYFNIESRVSGVKKVVIDFPNTVIRELWNSGGLVPRGVEELEVALSDNTTSLYMAFYSQHYAQESNYDLKKLKINFNTRNVTNWNFAIRTLAALTEITGQPLDFSSWDGATSGPFYAMDDSVLQSFRVAHSCIKHNFDAAIGSSSMPMTDDTLVSIANGLDAAAAPMVLTVSWRRHDYRPQMQGITGRNDNGTFVADDSGDINLIEFITDVKGWTLA